MTDLNLESLVIFNEVAKQESITKASEVLFISQPAVSQCIKKLETQLGGALFFRSNKGITLTEEGKCFYSYVKNALETIEKGKVEFENFRELKSGVINIGISTTLTKLILAEPLQKFHTLYPNVKINIVNDLTLNLVKELEFGELDFVIALDGKINENNFDIKKVKQLDYCFVYNKNFFDIKKEIPLKTLLSMPIILQKRPSNTRLIFDRFLTEKGINSTPETEVVSQELVQFFASIGLGVGFVIKDSLSFGNYDLCTVNLKETLPTASILLLTNKSKYLSFASKKLCEMVLEEE